MASGSSFDIIFFALVKDMYSKVLSKYSMYISFSIISIYFITKTEIIPLILLIIVNYFYYVKYPIWEMII